MEEETKVEQPEVVEEVVEQPVEETKEEVVEGKVEEEVETKKEEPKDEKEEPKELDVEELFNELDENDETYNFGEFNLSKYKDTLGLDDEESKETINTFLKPYLDSEVKFSQEQMEVILNQQLNFEEPVVEENKPITKEALREEFKKVLPKEAFGKLKYVNNFIGDMLQGTESEGLKKEIISNPGMVKMFYDMYNKSISKGKTGTLATVKAPVEKKIKSMTVDEGYNKLMSALSGNGKVDDVVEELKSNISDKQGLAELLSIVGK